MNLKKRTPALGRHLIVGVALGLALCASANAQTVFGGSTTLVFPVVASTSSFTGHVTLYNPNATDVTAQLDYFEANNLPAPGTRSCTDVVVPANTSIEFTLDEKCSLEPGSHFGLMTVSDAAGTNALLGYSRTENSAAIGFSIEAFPAANFTSAVSNVTGLKSGSTPPGFMTNCFVASLGGAVTYDLSLFDGTTGAQIGNTLSGSLNAFEQFRYLDIFAAAAAPAGDYSNVRAQFTRTSADSQPLIGFCTVQDNVSFGADFRIGKTQTVPPPVVQTLTSATWNGQMSTLNSNQLTYIFVGPTASATLNGDGTLTANGGGEFQTNTNTANITVAVCYQDATTLGLLSPISVPSSLVVTSAGPVVSFGTGSVSLPAGTYNVGLCAKNGGNVPVQKSGKTIGVVTIAQ
jgi:hypothetical protein